MIINQNMKYIIKQKTITKYIFIQILNKEKLKDVE